MEIQQAVRKPFYVNAVRITVANMIEVAKWCEGEIKYAKTKGEHTAPTPYVKVSVIRPLSERQSRGYIGDWVLQAGPGFKVYSDKAFREGFDMIEGEE